MKLYTEGTDQQCQNMKKKNLNLQRVYKHIAISIASDKNINFTKYQLFQNLLYAKYHSVHTNATVNQFRKIT